MRTNPVFCGEQLAAPQRFDHSRPAVGRRQIASLRYRRAAMNVAAAENTAVLSCYVGRQITLLSRQAKERVMAPIFDARRGAQLYVDFGYDTDPHSTFLREIRRRLSPHEAAACKARLAIERTGLPLGVRRADMGDLEDHPWMPEIRSPCESAGCARRMGRPRPLRRM